jgi:hypothetical protein
MTEPKAASSVCRCCYAIKRSEPWSTGDHGSARLPALLAPWPTFEFTILGEMLGLFGSLAPPIVAIRRAFRLLMASL